MSDEHSLADGPMMPAPRGPDIDRGGVHWGLGWSLVWPSSEAPRTRQPLVRRRIRWLRGEARLNRPPADLRLRSRVTLACWAYVASILVLCILLCRLGDYWWLATVLLYSPRWVWGLPLGVLVPAAAMVRPRSFWALSIAVALVVGPVMGLCVPWGAILAGDTEGLGLRALTCNVNGKHLDPNALATLVTLTRPDIVALQEWPEQHRSAIFRGQGWHIRASGGGHCLASRYPIRAVDVLDPIIQGGRVAAIRYDLETPAGILHVLNVHLATPRDGLESMRACGWGGVPALRANIAFRQDESEVASCWAGQVNGPTLIAGDFNLTSDSVIYCRYWSGYRNAFSTAGLGFGYTKYTRWHGARIDHILAGPGWQIRRCWTGSYVGSDHRPVIADMAWTGTYHETNCWRPGMLGRRGRGRSALERGSAEEVGRGAVPTW
jgi:endonuclease/exonuclease/phosphatase (EEP) superfamily protein YafD